MQSQIYLLEKSIIACEAIINSSIVSVALLNLYPPFLLQLNLIRSVRKNQNAVKVNKLFKKIREDKTTGTEQKIVKLETRLAKAV